MRAMRTSGGSRFRYAGSRAKPPSSIVAYIDNITFHPVPEPSTLLLLASGFVALLIARRRMM